MPAYVGTDSKLPVLSIAHNAGDFPPVIINLYPDWEKTGECSISYIKLGDLIETCRLLSFIIDAAADEVYHEQNIKSTEGNSEGDDLPF